MDNQEKRKLFSILNDDIERSTIDFLIITYETRNSQDFIEKLIGLEIEVIFLYIIAFRYLGVSLIRGLFFDKHSVNWFTQIPDPDKMMCLLDAINYAQFEGDHLRYSPTDLREELLFFMLLDIMRNPESLKDISGSVEDKQWEQYMLENRERSQR